MFPDKLLDLGFAIGITENSELCLEQSPGRRTDRGSLMWVSRASPGTTH